jgi:hypothetical protein
MCEAALRAAGRPLPPPPPVAPSRPRGSSKSFLVLLGGFGASSAALLTSIALWGPKGQVQPTTKAAPQKAATTPETAQLRKGLDPIAACTLLGGRFETGLWKRGSYDTGTRRYGWACMTSYVEIGPRNSPHQNNLAYYVFGDEDDARRLRFVLNMNNRRGEEAALEEFAELSAVLVRNAAGVSPSPEFAAALASGKPKVWSVERKDFTLSKDMHADGRGYKLALEVDFR